MIARWKKCSDRSIPLESAQELAEMCAGRIRKLGIAVYVCGSIRRKRPYVNDVDLVVVPREESDWAAVAAGFRRGEGFQGALVNHGKKIIRWLLQDQGRKVMVEAYRATEENLGMMMIVRTGSAQHNVKLAVAARARGLRFSFDRGVQDATGDVIAGRTEEEVFAALGFEFVPPECREVDSWLDYIPYRPAGGRDGD